MFDDETSRGILGDQFGAVNALFSGCAFAGLIYTIIQQNKSIDLQREDLRNQQEELKLNRNELKLQREEFEKQNTTMLVQRFEGIFFNMLHSLQEINSELRIQFISTEQQFIINNIGKKDRHFIDVQKDKCGREVFSILYKERGTFSNPSLKSFVRTNGIQAVNLFNDFALIEHYFSFILSILEQIDDETNGILDDDKRKYARILRSMLSPDEKCMLYYYGLSSKGRKLKSYIEKYSILHNLEDFMLLRSKELLDTIKEGNSNQIEKDLIEAGIKLSDYWFYMSSNISDQQYNVHAFCDDHGEEYILCNKLKNFHLILNKYK